MWAWKTARAWKTTTRICAQMRVVVLQSRVVFQTNNKSSCLPYNSKIYLSVAKSIMLFPRQYDQQTLQAAVN